MATFFAIVGFAAIVLATQFTKWTDRREGRRWWEDTPGSHK